MLSQTLVSRHEFLFPESDMKILASYSMFERMEDLVQ